MARGHSRAEKQAKVDDILSVVGLDPAAAGDRRPHEFSGGQCQRISIARAVVVEPELVICDEPVSALDVSVQAQILNLLEDMKERYGLTLLFIAHDLAVVKNVSDRVMVMYLGKLCEVAPPPTRSTLRRCTRTPRRCCRRSPPNPTRRWCPRTTHCRETCPRPSIRRADAAFAPAVPPGPLRSAPSRNRRCGRCVTGISSLAISPWTPISSGRRKELHPDERASHDSGRTSPIRRRYLHAGRAGRSLRHHPHPRSVAAHRSTTLLVG